MLRLRAGRFGTAPLGLRTASALPGGRLDGREVVESLVNGAGDPSRAGGRSGKLLRRVERDGITRRSEDSSRTGGRSGKLLRRNARVAIALWSGDSSRTGGRSGKLLRRLVLVATARCSGESSRTGGRSGKLLRRLPFVGGALRSLFSLAFCPASVGASLAFTSASAILGSACTAPEDADARLSREFAEVQREAHEEEGLDEGALEAGVHVLLLLLLLRLLHCVPHLGRTLITAALLKSITGAGSLSLELGLFRVATASA